MRKNDTFWVCVSWVVVLAAVGAAVVFALLAGNSREHSTPMPGWEKFEAGVVELWLPESWEGWDPTEGIDTVVEKLQNLGPGFDKYAQQLVQNPSMVVLWVYDLEVGESGGLTNVLVCKQGVFSTMTVDTYLGLVLQSLPAQFQVTEQGTVRLTDHEAGRLILEADLSGVEAKELMYVVKEGTTMWLITYSTGAQEFDQRLPVFEQSALTFAIQDQE